MAKQKAKINAGFSYVEIIMTTVVMAILVVAGMQLSGSIGRSTLEAVNQDIANRLALEMMIEMKNLAYKDAQYPDHFGPEFDEITGSRVNYDDIDDYNGWQSMPPVDKTGGSAGPDDLSRSVEISYVNASQFSVISADDQGFKSIIISVHRGTKLLAQQAYVFPDTEFTNRDLSGDNDEDEDEDEDDDDDDDD